MTHSRLRTRGLDHIKRSVRASSLTPCLILLVLLVMQVVPAASADTIVMGGTGWSIGMARLLAGEYIKTHPNVNIDVPDSVGSGGGIKAVLTGRFDLSFAARPIKKKNLGKGLTETPFVKTPFVLAVSPQAGANINMTSADVLATYSGKVTTWPSGLRVNNVLRSERETDTKMLIAHFDGIEPFLVARLKDRGALVATTDQEAMDIGEKVPGTLVPTTLLAMRTENRMLEPVAINGISPTLAHLEDNTWKMAITLRVVQRPKSSPAARAFVTYLLSDEAAVILRANGGIPIRK